MIWPLNRRNARRAVVTKPASGARVPSSNPFLDTIHDWMRGTTGTLRDGAPAPAMPHCDQAVLHAPGECRFCDAHPEWQALRELWGIAFTGHAPTDRQVPCPSDARRPGGVNQLWPGNRPRPPVGP